MLLKQEKEAVDLPGEVKKKAAGVSFAFAGSFYCPLLQASENEAAMK